MASLLTQRWYVLVDDLIGGYAIANVDKQRTSALDWRQGDSELGSLVSQEVAEHIVRMHNLRLDIIDYERRINEANDHKGSAGQRKDDNGQGPGTS